VGRGKRRAPLIVAAAGTGENHDAGRLRPRSVTTNHPELSHDLAPKSTSGRRSSRQCSARLKGEVIQPHPTPPSMSHRNVIFSGRRWCLEKGLGRLVRTQNVMVVTAALDSVRPPPGRAGPNKTGPLTAAFGQGAFSRGIDGQRVCSAPRRFFARREKNGRGGRPSLHHQIANGRVIDLNGQAAWIDVIFRSSFKGNWQQENQPGQARLG